MLLPRRNLCARLARLRQADSDGLLAAFDRFVRLSRFELPLFHLMKGALNLQRSLLPVFSRPGRFVLHIKHPERKVDVDLPSRQPRKRRTEAPVGHSSAAARHGSYTWLCRKACADIMAVALVGYRTKLQGAALSSEPVG